MSVIAEDILGFSPLRLESVIEAVNLDPKERAERILQLKDCKEFLAFVAEAKILAHEIKERSGGKERLAVLDEMLGLLAALSRSAEMRLRPPRTVTSIATLARYVRERLTGVAGDKNFSFGAGFSDKELDGLVAAYGRAEGIDTREKLLAALAEKEDSNGKPEP